MVTVSSQERTMEILGILPDRIKKEIVRVASQRRGGLSEIREIRIRALGRSSVLIGRECVALFSSVTEEEAERVVMNLCDGALYAHRDSIAAGYLTAFGGVRVGICGHAKYEEGELVGVSDIRSLVFRIPGHVCEFADALVKVFLSGVGRGMLVYSPPGGGKTTALRALAQRLGGGRDAMRVVIIDERCEFDERDYTDSEVDILKGYDRIRGIEIATRTMSPDVIMIDELGADDAQLLPQVVRSGVPLVATSHANSFEEIMEKPSLEPLLSARAFEVFVGICKDTEGYSLAVDRL